jgi:hypothetical protein
MKATAKVLVIAMAISAPLVTPDTLLAAADTASTPVEAPQGTGMAIMPMQQQMLHMQEEMAKIHDTKDPKERLDLMREHAQSMQEMMQMMHGMMAGQGMMGGHGGGMGMGMGMTSQGQMAAPGTGGPGTMGPGAMTPGVNAMMGRMGMMEQRMNLMQLMMDQMLEQQELLLEDRNDSGN